MRRKRLNGAMMGILAVLLVLFMSVGFAGDDWADERTDATGQWTYVLEGSGATVTGCAEEPSGNLVIPGVLDGYPVTGIGEFEFWYRNITGVAIPDSVTGIGDGAFCFCSGLTEVVIPDSCSSIGACAFMMCWNLSSVTIPAGVTDIGDRAFEGCSNLVLTVEGGSYAERYAMEYGFSYITTDAQVSSQEPKAVSSNQEPKTITVSTAQEFVDAIGSHTTIILSGGVYNLSEAAQDAFSTGEKAWNDVDDGKQLVIRDVYDLTIKGESPDCQIVVDPRDANVLVFSNCTGITIENITAGHTIQSEPCEGDVFSFRDCSDIRIINTHMFGCGAYGLYLSGVSGAAVENSSIYDCTAAIMYVDNCLDISFANCVFRDTTGGVVIYETKNATVDRCQFVNLECYALFDVEDSSDIVVINSSFTDNAAKAMDPSGLIRFENNTFTGNSFGGADEAPGAAQVLPERPASLREQGESREDGEELSYRNESYGLSFTLPDGWTPYLEDLVVFEGPEGSELTLRIELTQRRVDDALADSLNPALAEEWIRESDWFSDVTLTEFSTVLFASATDGKGRLYAIHLCRFTIEETYLFEGYLETLYAQMLFTDEESGMLGELAIIGRATESNPYPDFLIYDDIVLENIPRDVWTKLNAQLDEDW